jgi:hypothetical protein
MISALSMPCRQMDVDEPTFGVTVCGGICVGYDTDLGFKFGGGWGFDTGVSWNF